MCLLATKLEVSNFPGNVVSFDENVFQSLVYYWTYLSGTNNFYPGSEALCCNFCSIFTRAALDNIIEAGQDCLNT